MESTEEILCLKIYHLNQLWLNCSDNPFMKFGKHCVRPLMKNTIWNGYRIPVVRIGPTNISIAKEERPFAAYTQKAAALVLWLFWGEMRDRNLKLYGILFLMLFEGNTMKPKPIMMGNGSCLNLLTPLNLMTIWNCWPSKENRIENNISSFTR